ncbi:T9SS type A sorting domain-containing protein [Candidatus Neomarinimicrobiota bacterium]
MKIKMLTLIVVLVPTIAFSGTVIPVVAGTDAIATAFATAVAGDTLELTTSGGAYNEVNRTAIDKSLTIRAAAGLAAKPVWTTDDTLAIIVLSSVEATPTDLILQGIVLNGELGADSTEMGIVIADGARKYTLEADDCIFWGFGNSAKSGSAINGTQTGDDGAKWHTEGDALTINNCMFGNTRGEDLDFGYPAEGAREEGPMLDYYITNSTFWGLAYSEAMYLQHGGTSSSEVGLVSDPYVTIDHCTFINNSSKCIYPKYIDGAVVSNSISVSNVDDAIRIYGAASEIRNFLWFDCPSGIDYYNSSSGSVTPEGTNVLNVDPLIVDTDYITTGDFTLAAGSPAVGQDDDGGTLGDPRWYPGGSADWTEVTPGGTPSATEPASGAPSSFRLAQNYPNPFNPTTTIGFDLIKAGHVTLKVYNLVGQEVATLVDQPMGIGRHSVQWSGDGSVSAGIYFYRLSTSNNVQTQKMVLLK